MHYHQTRRVRLEAVSLKATCKWPLVTAVQEIVVLEIAALAIVVQVTAVQVTAVLATAALAIVVQVTVVQEIVALATVAPETGVQAKP